MKGATNHLNVDFIGNQSSLTKEEENAISIFFQQKKLKKEIKIYARPRTSKKKQQRNKIQ